jgi:hypothetical protein
VLSYVGRMNQFRVIVVLTVVFCKPSSVVLFHKTLFRARGIVATARFRAAFGVNK